MSFKMWDIGTFNHWKIIILYLKIVHFLIANPYQHRAYQSFISKFKSLTDDIHWVVQSGFLGIIKWVGNHIISQQS